MEINTKIIEIKQALGKESNKLYWQVETSEGRMTCHEKTVVDELLEFVGGMCNLAVRQSPKKDGDGFWTNIIGIAKDGDGIKYLKPKTQQIHSEIPKIVSGFNKITNEVLNAKPEINEKVIPDNELKPLINGKNLVSNDNEYTTMYVSYAKDIFVAFVAEKKVINDELMDDAIALVKQARDAFN